MWHQSVAVTQPSLATNIRKNRKHLHGNRRKQFVSSCWWFPQGGASFPWCPPEQKGFRVNLLLWLFTLFRDQVRSIKTKQIKKSSRYNIQVQFATRFLLQALREIKGIIVARRPFLQNVPVRNIKLNQVSVYPGLHEHLKLTMQRTI